MGHNVRRVTVTSTISIDPNIQRGASYTGILDLDELNKKLQDNYSLALAADFPLYKWFPDSGQLSCPAHYYEPPDNITARKAATLNKILDNLLLSHLPGWAELPDRETAATIFSSRNTADEFSKRSGGEKDHPGIMYRAVPVLNAKLVIAPAAHFRYCFQYALDQWGISNEEIWPLGKLHGCFYELFQACGIEGGFPFDWELFLTILNDIALEKIRPQRILSGNTEIIRATLIDHKTNLPDFLDNTFSPSNNGFKFIDYTAGLKKELYPDNEIWTASPCLLIEEKLFDKKGY